jgi:hypothetical protein
VTVDGGLNLREALDAARRLGCTVASVPGTGEVLMVSAAVTASGSFAAMGV